MNARCATCLLGCGIKALVVSLCLRTYRGPANTSGTRPEHAHGLKFSVQGEFMECSQQQQQGVEGGTVVERPRSAVLVGCTAASMATTAVGIFAGIFLHPGMLLLLVLGNAASMALALRFGYLPEATKASGGKAMAVPVIHIHPPKIVTEL
ncbi:uncharacterized protein LOC144155868 isoform X1 [Haemaphysalis longicornis]